MPNTETVLDKLKKFDIDEGTLALWERELGLAVPMNEQGEKQYSPHHINLFKNIRKHLALGRTLDEVKRLIMLPPESNARQSDVTATLSPETVQRDRDALQPRSASRAMPQSQEWASTGQPEAPTVTQTPLKSYGTAPKRAQAPGAPGRDAQDMVQLVDRLMTEKDQLGKKLAETEKLNSHLYNANNLFHRKVKELTAYVATLKEHMQEHHSIKLMDAKSKLHEQLLEMEKKVLRLERDLKAKEHEADTLRRQLMAMDNRLKEATGEFNPTLFCGDWLEHSALAEVAYDNFGINVEKTRQRRFRISEPPRKTFANTAVLTTHYQYETNKLWRRTETLTLTYVKSNRLEGELVSEYILDGVPVAKVLYKVVCTR